MTQLNRYLHDELGKFGVLVTRSELGRAQQKRVIDLWSGQRKAIVTLTDMDVEQMVGIVREQAKGSARRTKEEIRAVPANLSIGLKGEMKTKADIEILEKTMGQLRVIHQEISILSKKSPNDAVNVFKLRLINSVLNAANGLLGESYRPLADFEEFDEDDLPSTSDVAFVVAQYMEEIGRFRSDHIVLNGFKRVYVLSGKPSNICAH